MEADPEILVVACCGFDVDRALQDVSILRSYPDIEAVRALYRASLIALLREEWDQSWTRVGSEWDRRSGPLLWASADADLTTGRNR